MTETLQSVRRTVVIVNPNGLHMRPATSFAFQPRLIRDNFRDEGKLAVEHRVGRVHR